MELRANAKDGDPCFPGQEPEIAPGVRGYVMEDQKGVFWIPLIRASTPGNGDVGRFLDDLPTDRSIVFPTILSPKLQGMLHRRGFKTILVEGAEAMKREPRDCVSPRSDWTLEEMVARVRRIADTAKHPAIRSDHKKLLAWLEELQEFRRRTGRKERG